MQLRAGLDTGYAKYAFLRAAILASTPQGCTSI
jgi:hypothetical protein